LPLLTKRLRMGIAGYVPAYHTGTLITALLTKVRVKLIQKN